MKRESSGLIHLMSEADYEAFVDEQVQEVESRLSQILEGRESIVFLAPMGAHGSITVEAWQAVAQWDLQKSDCNRGYGRPQQHLPG